MVVSCTILDLGIGGAVRSNRFTPGERVPIPTGLCIWPLHYFDVYFFIEQLFIGSLGYIALHGKLRDGIGSVSSMTQYGMKSRVSIPVG
jgi:hypothetical protein